MTVGRETLIAFADGELSEFERRRVEKAVAADPALASEVEAHKRLRERLAAHYAPVADSPVPPRLTALLEEKVVPLDAARERRSARFAPQHWAAIAATLVLGLVVGGGLNRGDGPVTSSYGPLIASSSLDRALETQLASTQPASADIRIGLTFRTPNGEVCRTFDSQFFEGIACRFGESWRLQHTTGKEGVEGTTYRQASASALAEVAQTMMAGEPLNAARERAAKERGWR